jgi:hypothetical protein
MWILIETTAGVSTYEWVRDARCIPFSLPDVPIRNISPTYIVANRVRVDVLPCAPML